MNKIKIIIIFASLTVSGIFLKQKVDRSPVIAQEQNESCHDSVGCDTNACSTINSNPACGDCTFRRCRLYGDRCGTACNQGSCYNSTPVECEYVCGTCNNRFTCPAAPSRVCSDTCPAPDEDRYDYGPIGKCKAGEIRIKIIKRYKWLENGVCLDEICSQDDVCISAPSATPTGPSRTPTPTVPSATPTPTIPICIPTPTTRPGAPTPTPTPSGAPTATPMPICVTVTPKPSVTPSITLTPTKTPIPSPTRTPTLTRTPTPTRKPSVCGY